MTDGDTEDTSPQAEDSEETSKARSRKSFWSTLPGILTGLAAVVTAVGGLTPFYPPLRY